VAIKLYVSYQNIQFRSYQFVECNLYIRICSYKIVCFLQTYQLVANKLYGFLTNQIVRVGKCQLVADFESYLRKAGKQRSNNVEVGRVSANEM
jgi:hypothetical protein